MARNINRLLSKNSWTGKEVGIAILMSLEHDLTSNNNPNDKGLFSQEEYQKMVNSLSTDYQYTQYKVYEAIHNSIAESFNINEGQIQQFYSGYYRYLLLLEETNRAENYLKSIEKFPLILTQAQYDELTEKCATRNRNIKESFYSLFFNTVTEFIFNYDFSKNNPDQQVYGAIPENIKADIEGTKKEKVTNQRILSNWIEDTGDGYFTLPDGRRSDDMDINEWTKAAEALFMEHHKYYINGKLQNFETTVEHYNNEKYFYANQLLFKGKEAIRAAYKEKTGKELSEADLTELEKICEDILLELITPYSGYDAKEKKQELINGLFYDKDEPKPEFHKYTEPPAELTKYDILLYTLERYSGEYEDRLKDGKRVAEIPEREQFKEFKADYPALYEAIKNYIEEKIPTLKGLKANQLYKDIITQGELADMNYLNYKDRIKVLDYERIEEFTKEDTTKNINKRKRGRFNGIAILSEPNKLYIDPVDYTFATEETLHSLDYLKDNMDDVKYMNDSLNYLAIPALKYLYAYNAYIDIICDIYDIKFMKTVKRDLTAQENQIEASNNMLYQTYREIYGTEEDKKRKRDFLKKNFQPIEIEKLKPAKQRIDQVKKEIEELGYTKKAAAAIRKHFQHYIFKLMIEGAD